MTNDIAVSDHVVLRYLERVAGLDIERLRRGIRRKTRHAVNAGARSVTIDGFTYVIANGCVVTVVPADNSHEPELVFGLPPRKRRPRKRPSRRIAG